MKIKKTKKTSLLFFPWSLTLLTVAAFLTVIHSPKAHAQPSLTQDLKGRVGLGMSRQLVNDIPSLSLKMQKSRSYAFGLLLGYKNSDREDGTGVGLRIYRILFDEPLLNFYSAGTVALVSQKLNQESKSGFQVDATLGTEFHFPGIESIGFSFEFGFSVNKLGDDFTMEILGQHMLQAGIHFYI